VNPEGIKGGIFFGVVLATTMDCVPCLNSGETVTERSCPLKLWFDDEPGIFVYISPSATYLNWSKFLCEIASIGEFVGDEDALSE
jgi:hypothetical protein